MSTQTDSLARAIDYLDAVLIEQTQVVNRLWAVRLFDRYFIADADTLSTFRCVPLSLADAKGYFDAEMPSWWTPTQQSVWRITLPGDHEHRANQIYVREDDYRQFGKPRNAKSERVTANLATGEEVSA